MKITKSNHSPLMQFMILACNIEHTEQETTFMTTLLRSITPEELFHLSYRHGVLPLMYKSIKELMKSDEKKTRNNSHLLELLKQNYQFIIQKNMLMSAELIHIINLLKKNNIEVLSFKGPSLAKQAYGDITLRQFGDLDILVKREDLTTILLLLTNDGYIPEINITIETEKYLFDTLNVIALHKPFNGIYLEIHWILLSKNYAINWGTDSLWKNKTFTMINHHQIDTLPTEQLLLYLCAHGSKHLFERLEWVCDIDRLIRSESDLDWELILNQAQSLDIERMLYVGLSLSNYLLCSPIPKRVQPKIENDPKVKSLVFSIVQMNFSDQTHKNYAYRSFFILLAMRKRIKSKLAFLFQAFFAPQYDDFKHIKLPTYLIFLYPIIRLYRLITKYFPYRSKIVN